MGSKKLNGDQPKMSKAQDGWYPSFTAGTQRHCNTYPPSISLISPFSPYQTSLIPQTWYPQDGPQVIMHWDVMPLRGGVNFRVFPVQCLSTPTNQSLTFLQS